jgi:2-methylcitrate dehydratase PrpD
MVFSIPIALAAVAYGSCLGPEWQSWASVRDHRLQAFAEKVIVQPNNELRDETGAAPALPALGSLPTRVPTRVDVAARGQRFSAQTDFAWGDPWTPESRMSDDDLRAKFRRFTAGSLRSSRIEEVLDVVFALDACSDVTRELSPLLR